MVRARLTQRARLRKKAKVFAMTKVSQHKYFAFYFSSDVSKGFRGRRKNCYSLAVRAAHKAMQYAYIGRKLKKRFLRSVSEIAFIFDGINFANIFFYFANRCYAMYLSICVVKLYFCSYGYRGSHMLYKNTNYHTTLSFAV